ncbi:hypothetical protein B0A69_16585 [Chryseobacterium shigense]|uniref:Uncharacterized protein n=1 Tax=Chryseobacterium shigense TaxID=297244 RepID=A0A1N7HX07_9FLAO|nr:hypothetical protein [Chryseobacterium shigense]PQA92035.1 hypothetical protein B0A69_16585 [Chryseobacterium shigense]SIS29375.1 hypothetical protein SAMN05421639_101444 [Chryseobacterium shigense]
MELHDNEIILKEILPKKSFFFNMTEKIRVIFSFFYLGVSSILLINMTSFFFFFAIIFFGAGLYFAFFRWVLRYFDLRDNYYLITNERIIVAEKLTKEIIKEKKLAEIDQVNIEMNNQFFGNIIFGEPETIFGKNDEPFSFFKTKGMNFNEDEYAFISVDNISEIIPVFENLKLKVNKTFY